MNNSVRKQIMLERLLVKPHTVNLNYTVLSAEFKLQQAN